MPDITITLSEEALRHWATFAVDPYMDDVRREVHVALTAACRQWVEDNPPIPEGTITDTRPATPDDVINEVERRLEDTEWSSSAEDRSRVALLHIAAYRRGNARAVVEEHSIPEEPPIGTIVNVIFHVEATDDGEIQWWAETDTTTENFYSIGSTLIECREKMVKALTAELGPVTLIEEVATADTIPEEPPIGTSVAAGGRVWKRVDPPGWQSGLARESWGYLNEHMAPVTIVEPEREQTAAERYLDERWPIVEPDPPQRTEYRLYYGKPGDGTYHRTIRGGDLRPGDRLAGGVVEHITTAPDGYIHAYIDGQTLFSGWPNTLIVLEES